MKKNNKGFTLAELLIVVAIIAVLVAIAIPIFTSQLEKARDAVSVSNMRAAYAEAAAEYLTWDGKTAYVKQPGSHVASITDASGVVTITVEGVDIKSQEANAWSQVATDLPFKPYTDPGVVKDDGTATFTYTKATGAWELTGIA